VDVLCLRGGSDIDIGITDSLAPQSQPNNSKKPPPSGNAGGNPPPPESPDNSKRGSYHDRKSRSRLYHPERTPKESKLNLRNTAPYLGKATEDFEETWMCMELYNADQPYLFTNPELKLQDC
jgi:hypothetical protein